MKQILVIQNKRIGDVLISSVLANNLKKRFPESTITYLVYPYTAGVLEHNPNIDHIWTVDEKWLKKLPNLLKMIHQVRRKKFDIIFDPYAKLQSRLLSYFSGAAYRIGFKRPGKKLLLPFYSHPVHFIPKRTKFCGKAIENRLNLVNSVFPMQELDDTPKIYVTEKEANYNRIQHLKKPVIMLGVLGSTPQKSMPYKYVAALIDYIAENYDASLLFNYAPYQKTEAEAIYNLCAHKDQIHLAIYEDSIRGFITLMNQCDLLISNEGGSVHIAKALNKPTFTMYSPYIEKEDWNSFEDGMKHQSVHLLDFKPELYESFTREERKAIEADPSRLYLELTPDLILASLKPYLKNHLAT
jgi:ADP-heptose:LPS heptosyltransferase